MYIYMASDDQVWSWEYILGMDVSLCSVKWGAGCCPCSMPPPPPPPLHVGDGSKKEQQGHYSLAPATSQELPEWGRVQWQTALSTPTPDFPWGLLLKPFPKKGNCKATVIIARWPPLALQNRYPLTDLVLTSIWVSNHPPHNLSCKKWWGCRFNCWRLDSEAGSTGLQVTNSKTIRPDLTCDHDQYHSAFAQHNGQKKD